jgi:hypothetical protein
MQSAAHKHCAQGAFTHAPSHICYLLLLCSRDHVRTQVIGLRVAPVPNFKYWIGGMGLICGGETETARARLCSEAVRQRL